MQANGFIRDALDQLIAVAGEGLCFYSILAIGVVIAFGYAVYQVYFHPLAQYPGPLLGKFVPIDVVYRLSGRSKGDVHLHIRDCHLKYGPILRYGPNVLIFNTVAGLKDIYSGHMALEKDDVYQALHIGANSILTATDRDDHARRAKLIGPGLSGPSIKNFEPRIMAHVVTLLDRLYPIDDPTGTWDLWGPPVMLSDWCSYFTIDVITELVFGRSGNLMSMPKLRTVVADMERMFQHASVVAYATFLLIGRLDKLIFRDEIRGTRRYRRFVRAMMKEPGQNNVYSRIANAHLPSSRSPLSDVEVCSETALLVVAGSDTTSAALCAILFNLARYPHSYDRLCREIRHTFKTFANIHTGTELDSCVYLDACIKEALRISPAVASALYRKVGTNGATIDGVYVPKGCSVATGIYSIHHNGRYFSQPDIFSPERWLPREDCGMTATSAAHVPFSLGPRACIGRNLALTELQLATAAILWKYDFRFSTTHRETVGSGHPLGNRGRTNPMEFQVYDHIVSQKRGPVLQFRPRVA